MIKNFMNLVLASCFWLRYLVTWIEVQLLCNVGFLSRTCSWGGWAVSFLSLSLSRLDKTRRWLNFWQELKQQLSCVSYLSFVSIYTSPSRDGSSLRSILSHQSLFTSPKLLNPMAYTPLRDLTQQFATWQMSHELNKMSTSCSAWN